MEDLAEKNESTEMSALDYLLSTDDINFFQISENNSPYFLDSTTYKRYYFINKANLPDDIKSLIKGGDNINKGIYTTFEDVYGVSSDLKVYYCSNGIDSSVNVVLDGGEENLSKNILTQEKDSEFISVLGYDSDVSLSNLRSVQELTINKNGLDLTKLMYFSNLKKITFIGVQYDNLNGIQYVPDLNYIYFQKTSINNYSQIANVAKLQYLYFWKTTDEDITRLCDSINGIGQKDISTLRYFSVSDTTDTRSINTNWFEGNRVKSDKSSVTTIEPLRNLSNITKNAIKYLTVEFTEIKDLTPLRDFTSVNLLVIDNNEINSLDGLENMTNLNSLTCYSNPLAKDSINTSYNSETDSLKALINLKKLSYIRMGNCPNLVYLDSMIGKTSISTWDIRACSNLDEISVSNARNEIVLGGTLIDPKYQFALADKNTTTTLDLSNTDVTIAQLKMLGDFSNLKSLNLSNIKINGSTDGTKIEEAVNALNSSLIKLNKLYALSLVNFKGFNDCSKLVNMNNPVQVNSNGYTIATYLDLRGTGVNTNSDSTGLQILNNKRISGLIVDGSEINLVKIQPILNQFIYHCSFPTASLEDIGLICKNTTSLKTIENCTDLVCWVGRGQNYSYSMNITLNLSNLTKLKSIAFNHTYFTKIICPANLEILASLTSGSTAFDVSACTKLKSIYLDAYTNESLFLQTIKGKTSVEKLQINEYRPINNIFVNNLDTIATLTNLKEIYLCSSHWNSNRINIPTLGNLSKLSGMQNLTKLYIEHIAVSDKNFSGISNLSKLKYLTISDSNVENISFLTDLVNLIEVNLYKNSINAGFSNIENLVNLRSLNLNNNSIQDIETVNSVNINIIDKLINLHKSNSGKSLEYLYLSGNNGISSTGKEKLNSKSWLGKSGF